MNHRDETNSAALLSIDLDAICDNWRLLKSRLNGAECAAVVKADAYGLGADSVAPALFRAGCRHFFVAHINEAIELRPALDPDATLYVLHGITPGAELEFITHDLVPVLNSLTQVDCWRTMARQLDRRLPAILQFDTGMARLGLDNSEITALALNPELLDGIDLKFAMSHLVSAEDYHDPINTLQLDRFGEGLKKLSIKKASLANSSGIFLGDAFHFDLVRPGAALYGVAPIAGQPNPMRAVIRLQGKVIQTRTIDAGATVGYSHTWTAGQRTRIATVSVGYADGYLRSLGNRGSVRFNHIELPLVGNVSMDTITIDVSKIPETQIHAGTLIDLIDPINGVDAIAEDAGTIGYEILTSLGNRYARRYLGACSAFPEHLRAC
ncbi:MAG: alanine racemase [Candidatus Thiodiazotropha sp. (ex Cardiolucina cf. quadrata)]|nr:alanine racemase [Candidatus Thiodiazotropha sp. (ex Cardiolucina cf. quadrata)]